MIALLKVLSLEQEALEEYGIFRVDG